MGTKIPEKIPEKIILPLEKKKIPSEKKSFMVTELYKQHQGEMSLNRCKELGPGFYPNDLTHTGEKYNRHGKLFSAIIILERNHIVESKLG